jgi:hypothetical protein
MGNLLTTPQGLYLVSGALTLSELEKNMPEEQLQNLKNWQETIPDMDKITSYDTYTKNAVDTLPSSTQISEDIRTKYLNFFNNLRYLSGLSYDNKTVTTFAVIVKSYFPVFEYAQQLSEPDKNLISGIDNRMVATKLEFFSPYKSGLITDYINKYISEVNNTTFSLPTIKEQILLLLNNAKLGDIKSIPVYGSSQNSPQSPGSNNSMMIGIVILIIGLIIFIILRNKNKKSLFGRKKFSFGRKLK